MSTPKIKLYRLFPGYASQNDNDIQNATNDQLLPITLKNIMPTNAYTLVGVGKKQLQTLTPVLDHKFLDDTELIKITDKIFRIPQTAISKDSQKFIQVNRTNRMPIFYIKTQDLNSNNIQQEYKPGVQYIYVKDIQSYEKSDISKEGIQFVLYYKQIQGYWYIEFVGQGTIPGIIYIRNAFETILKEIQVQNVTFSSTESIYYLSKSSGLNQVVGNNHEFIPYIGEHVSYHLRPTITFEVNAEQVMSQEQLSAYSNTISSNSSNSSDSSDSSYSSGTDDSDWFVKKVVLTQQDGYFTIDQNFRLTNVNVSNSKNSIHIKFGNEEGKYEYQLPFEFLYGNKNIPSRKCTLKYYVIPKFSELKNWGQQPYVNLLNSTNLFFMAQQQDAYNGTRNATKPNTLYLQYVKSAKMFYEADSENPRKQNYTIYNNTTGGDIYPKLEECTCYCRGIIPRGSYPKISILSCNFRTVYNVGNVDYVQNNYTDKGLSFPQSQYVLDTDKGIYYFSKYTNGNFVKTIFSDSFVNSNDYFFVTYYYRASVAKMFISDFQSWVTEHLRNNPDIFYGKKDYPGDDYIDANENAIKVGEIPRYIEPGSGYTIYFRNGSVTFASDTQDLDYIGSTNQTNVSTQNSGLLRGGVARANFAYYNGLQNVLDQKLQWDKSYNGGGYKYRALTDKQYPDSIGRRWVKRDNPLQFIGASFITQKLNDKGQLKTYNLPDLQTIQLQELNQYGFAKCLLHEGTSNSPKIFLDYFITTNNFSYLFAFKISNFRRTFNDNDPLYITSMNDETVKKRHPNLMGKNVDLVFDRVNSKNKFEQNEIVFETLEKEQLDHINVKYNELSILPALNVKIPVLTELVNKNVSTIQIIKNKDCSYSDFEVWNLDTNNKLVFKTNDVKSVQTDNYIYIEIPQQYRESNYYFKYRMSTNLYRNYNQSYDKMSFNTIQSDIEGDSSSQSSNSQSSYVNGEKMLSISSNYKFEQQNNNEIIFSISNVNQTVYFKLNVIDFYSVENIYSSTIVYTIKKYDL